MAITAIVRNEKNGKFIYISMLVILFIFMPDFKSEISTENLSLSLSFFFTTAFIHFLTQKDKNWFRMDVLFLLGFVIVHFQWAIMLAFSNIDLGYLNFIKYGSVDLKYINYGTWLSTVGIIAWFLGHAWIPIKKKNNVLYKIKYKKLLWVSVVLFVLFLMLAGSSFLSGGIYKGHGGSSAGAGISVYFQLLFGISILVLTTVVILNSKDKPNTKLITWFLKLDKKYLLLSGIYVLLFLSIGDRGAGMQVAFTFLVTFGAIVRPISFKQFSAIIIVGAIILTLIGLGRSVDSGENILVAGANKVEFTSNYDVTMELANSARTLYSALENVPNHHDYFFGKLWLGKFLAVIPMSQNIYLQLSNDKSYELGSAGYITYLRFGVNPYSGEGTSLIADIYLNFGLIGVIFFMFILGLFMKKLQNELNIQKKIYWIIAAGIFASIAFYMGRGNLFGGLRPIVWGLILVVIFVKYKKVSA
jgi:oligosaccharide repeat unit polymerase